MSFLSVIHITLFIILSGFLSIYIGAVLSGSKPITSDTIFLRVGAGMFVLIIFGSVISWLQDCKLSLGLPTFGLEDRVTVIG